MNVADGVGSCFTFDDVSNAQSSLQKGINKSRVDEFLRAIAQTRSLVEESVERGSNEMNADYSHRTDSILNWCLNMKEKLKCLRALIYGVHFERVDACVERLEACERALRQHKSLHERKTTINDEHVNGRLFGKNKNPSFLVCLFKKFY